MLPNFPPLSPVGNPTPNSPDKRQSPQSSPCPAPGSAMAGGLAMVLPPSRTLAPSHPQSWQKEACVSFPAVSWTSLTACLQILVITLPELSSRQWLLPWELSERSGMCFHRQTECFCTSRMWLHHLVYGLSKSCTHFQGRLHDTSQSEHPKSQFSSWCFRVAL